jgi:hypothetical protein
MGGEHRSGRWIAACLATSGLVALTGCGKSSHKVSAASLKSRLAPLSIVPHGFHLLRTLDWSDPVDLAGEGIRAPEITHPSQVIAEIRSRGFQGAAGEQLNQGGPTGTTITTGVIKLSSAANATKLRDWMHKQDLTQPCFAQCIFSPRNFAISGVPNLTAVRQVPNQRAPSGPPPGVKVPKGVKLPPGAASGPPTNYLFEFTIGKYLYFAWGQGEAKDAAKFVTGARTYYSAVKGLPSS